MIAHRCTRLRCEIVGGKLMGPRKGTGGGGAKSSPENRVGAGFEFEDAEGPLVGLTDTDFGFATTEVG